MMCFIPDPKQNLQVNFQNKKSTITLIPTILNLENEKLKTTAADHPQSREFNFNFNSERSVFDFGVEGNNGNWKVFIIADEKRRLLQIISSVQYAPHANNNNQCELLTRMNEDILLEQVQYGF